MKRFDYLDGFYGFESDEFEYKSIDKIFDDIQESGVWDKELIEDLKKYLGLKLPPSGYVVAEVAKVVKRHTKDLVSEKEKLPAREEDIDK